jgi:DNA-binding response OmpR family regulator
MAQRVLVANGNIAVQEELTDLLTLAGYHAIGVTTFEEARFLLDQAPPDLLIAHLRLGAFNGLHLVLRGRADSPDMAAIVTMDEQDQALKSEARRLGAQCVMTPVASKAFLKVVADLLEPRTVAVVH